MIFPLYNASITGDFPAMFLGDPYEVSAKSKGNPLNEIGV